MANNPKIRSAYDGTRVQVSAKNFDPSQTIQDQKDSCDINLILQKYNRTGVIEHVKEIDGQFGDYTGMDYQDMMNQVARADQVFMTLPSAERAKFNHSTAEWLDHIQNPDNIEDMRDGSIDNAPSLDGQPDIKEPETPVEGG